MATALAFLFFGVIVVASIFSAAKIQRAELADAREEKEIARAAERARQKRLADFRAKGCQRADGD